MKPISFKWQVQRSTGIDLNIVRCQFRIPVESTHSIFRITRIPGGHQFLKILRELLFQLLLVTHTMTLAWLLFYKTPLDLRSPDPSSTILSHGTETITPLWQVRMFRHRWHTPKKIVRELFKNAIINESLDKAPGCRNYLF